MEEKARILLDSVGVDGSAPRLTTWMLTIPRMLLPELNTHRAFSRNAASSRAIPIWRRVKTCLQHPFIPVHIGLNQAGMQASQEASGIRFFLARGVWRLAALCAVGGALALKALGVHKQIGNRLLEPFLEVTVLVTTTQKGIENFFALRADALAEPHFRDLAQEMLHLYNANTPFVKVLQRGEWHIPFGDNMPPLVSEGQKLKIAVARAARLSYDVTDGTGCSVAKDIKLHDTLAEHRHWSSFEHVAKVPEVGEKVPVSNLDGWFQLRKTYPNECQSDARVNPTNPEILGAKNDRP